jgi:hypothetical protein
MSFKGLLGLDSLQLTDYAIMEKFREARGRNIETLEFYTHSGKVTVNLSHVDALGMMRDGWQQL